jgi:hypothetical protein
MIRIRMNGIGEKKLNKIIFSSPEVRLSAGAHYDYSGEIHLCYSTCGITTLVHELAHHCGARGHDDKFIMIEEILFALVVEHQKELTDTQ